MDDARIQDVLNNTEGALQDYHVVLSSYTALIRKDVRENCVVLRQEVSLNIASSEVVLTRVTIVISQSAEYHILRAYFHASPSLILILTAIYGFVMVVIDVISIINTTLMIITGETLAHWLDIVWPGFAAAWADVMNKVSEFSAVLGWGVDGVHHLLNVAHTSADLWGTITGKTADPIRVAKYEHTEALLKSYSNNLARWQSNPGEMISQYAEQASALNFQAGYAAIHNLTSKLDIVMESTNNVFKHLGRISDELLELRNGMPAIIAKYIPSGIWDGILMVDTAINDRILPAMTKITDRIDEVDAVLDAHRKKAEELSDKIAHPGDMLMEINNLPYWARMDQSGKIDEASSWKMARDNREGFAAVEVDLRAFAVTAEALTHPPASIPFMELELPGRSPGIVAEPRETWFVGDY